MKLIEFDEEIIGYIPSIMKLLHEMFGDVPIKLMATLEGKKSLGFIARVNEHGVYIDSTGEYTIFSLNEEDNLSAVTIDGTTVVYEDTLCFVKEGKEYSLSIMRQEPDEEGYDGLVNFFQYDREKDVMCRIDYQQMYREYDGFAPIYSFHTRRMYSVSIEEEYNSVDERRVGILPKRSKFYGKLQFSEGEIGYDITSIKEYGLVETLMKGSYNLIRDKEIVRYVKSFMLTKYGNYIDAWPLARTLTESEMQEIVRGYGFETEVPEFMLSVYNGSNRRVNTIKEIVELLREHKKAMLDEGQDPKILCMKIKND